MKRTFLKIAAAAACAAVLAGCAATGAKYAEIASTIPAVKADQSRVYFFRASSMVGAAVQPDVRLDGKVVGESKPGGFFYVDTTPGAHVASVATETEKTLSFTLAAGETKYVRQSIGFGVAMGRVVLDLEAAEKARTELADLAHTGAKPGQQASK